MEMLTNPRTAGDEEKEGTRRQDCPYLRRTRMTSWYPIEGYCLAHSDGGLRVVTVAEFHELCTKAEHIRCELYCGRRGKGHAAGEPEQGGA
jgi:hypothetical protein